MAASGLVIVLVLATACTQSESPPLAATASAPFATTATVAPASATAAEPDEGDLREYLETVNTAFTELEKEGMALGEGLAAAQEVLVGTPVTEAEYFAGWAAYGRAGSLLAAGMLGRLEALDPPEEMEVWHTHAVALYRTARDAYDEVARAAGAHDQQALESAVDAVDVVTGEEAAALDDEWNRIVKEVFPGRPTRPLGQP